MRCSNWPRLVVMMAGTSALAHSALAQTATSDQPLQTVLVTAQKRAESLTDVPLSVVSATNEQLREMGIAAPGDLEKLIPGFSYTQSPYGAPVFTIRGIGFFDESVGSSPAVTIYVDEVPIAFSRATEGAILDLERVEVLEGPQGTLFGQNSTGGAINFIAAKPTRSFTAGAAVSYGRFDEVDAEGFLSGPITDALTVRLAARTDKRNNWQQSTSRDATLATEDFTTARLLLDWTPTHSLKVEINANGWRDRSDTQANQFQGYSASAINGYPGSAEFPHLAADLTALPPAPQNDRAADWDPDQSFRRDDHFYQVSARVDWEVTPAAILTSISAYSELRVDSPQDVDGTQFPVLGVTVDAFTDTYFQELRLAGAVAEYERLHWMLGGNYQHDHVSDVQHIENQGSNSGVGPYRFVYFDNVGKQQINTAAAFGSVDYEFRPALSIEASARYTQQDISFDGCLVDSGDGALSTAFGFLSTVLNGDPHEPTPGDPSYIPPGKCVTLDPITNLAVQDVHRTLNEDNVSWRLGLSWKPSPATLVYGNVTRGYKGGTFETLPAIRPAQLDPIPQESVTAYEVGTRAATPNRAVEVSGALFWLDYKDKQLLGYISDSFFGNLPGLVSVPKSEVLGAELRLDTRPNQAWRFSLGSAYIHSKVLSDFTTLGPLATSGTFNIKGEPFPNTPEWSLVAETEYNWPLSARWVGYVGATVLYHSRANSTFAEPPEFEINSYATADARMGFQKTDGSLRLELWGRNIADRYYWQHVDHVLDTITRVAGMPATFGMTATIRL